MSIFSKVTKTISYILVILNDLKRRLREHNASSSKATRSRLPLKLVYYEAYLSEKDAKDREFKPKRFAGSYIHLKHRIRNSLILSK